MRRAKTCLLSALVTLAACSGGSGAADPAAGGQAPQAAPLAARPPEPAGAESERKLRAAQESAVEAMCERLVDCAVESARANMSPEEVAKLDVDKTAPRLREECEDDGSKSDLSPRQVHVVQRCVTDAETCDALQTCLEQASKRD